LTPLVFVGENKGGAKKLQQSARYCGYVDLRGTADMRMHKIVLNLDFAVSNNPCRCYVACKPLDVL
jgi:hypothetical protein